MTQPGWYPDPQDAASVRYFDGQAWTEHRRPAPAQWSAPPTNPSTAGAWSAPPAQPWAPPPGGWVPQPVPGGKRRRTPFIIGLVIVLVLAGGAVAAWQLLKPSPPSLTYQGQKIANAAALLSHADADLATEVSSRHGTKSPDSRCYFTRPTSPSGTAKKSDVSQILVCGPVLFVDGNAADEYLSYSLTATGTSGGATTLTVSDDPTNPDPQPLPTATRLSRPDNKTAPAGPGGLAVPRPPAAAANTLVSATLDSDTTLATPSNAEMISQSTGVKIDSVGPVSRYGQGDDARSAPSGSKLIAFQYEAVNGESNDDDPGPDLSITVGEGAPRPVPENAGANDFVVVAVPAGASASLILKADGYTQTLSLPAAKPGPDNLTVLTRKNREATVNKSFRLPIELSNGSASASDTYSATISTVALEFWPVAVPQDHPAKPGDSYLVPHLTYTDARNPGGTYGFDPSLLRLRLPDGTVVRAKNLATGDKVYNVFEVPGTFTTGTLIIGGSESLEGITISVTTSQSIPIAIAAG